MSNGFNITIPVSGVFVVWSGPNGAGKTNAKRRFWNPKLVYIDPDEIQKGLNTSISLVASNHASGQMIANLKTDDNASFGLETTLAGKRAEGLVEWAKNYNYKVVLCYFVTSSVNVCIDNVRRRVNDEHGHDVPESDIKTRYASSLENFIRMCKHVDEWYMVFNNGQYTLVAQSVNGKAECVSPDAVPLLPQELQNALPQLVPTFCH